MTLLQRAVILRLRERGYEALADAAADAWPNNERCNMPNLVGERDRELRPDYERANEQARIVLDCC